ncbi:MAG: DNA-3-methyladenine glycosylase [Acidimicrobiales bacterium]
MTARQSRADADRFETAALPRAFFERPPDVVARELVGCLLVVHDPGALRRALLVETEAYGGADDPASHAYRGPTPRSAVMFGPAGVLYVYRSYGVHWCANVVTGGTGVPGAVLLRGAQIVAPASDVGTAALLRGPGNLTRGLAITGEDQARDCCAGPGARITLHAPRGATRQAIVARSARVGLTKAPERMSRYYLAGHPAVSAGPR